MTEYISIFIIFSYKIYLIDILSYIQLSIESYANSILLIKHFQNDKI